ncbi:hypothetical protein WA026_000348 [Henosepilachna vigintioctopunctata]|uniref:Uncharacterized protein n=1 Tax=Henosepilachna vigintioctopunctata TaxID=420089 RepID=A0AAW1V3X1_9CUCU
MPEKADTEEKPLFFIGFYCLLAHFCDAFEVRNERTHGFKSVVYNSESILYRTVITERPQGVRERGVTSISMGETNQEANAFSRNPVLESLENSDDILQVVNLVTLEDIKSDQDSMEIDKSDNTLKEKNGLIYKKLRSRER